MQIHSLDKISLEDLAETFNKAFENYFVPIQLNAELLAQKIKAENIVLEYSAGITINNRLVGFILIGIHPESKTAYNAGTGIISEFRGQTLTEKLYAFLLPELDKIGIKNHQLEVICENEKAISIYKNIGYSITRKVICYKGKISKPKESGLEITEIDFPNENEIRAFWNQIPAYQNSSFCIKNASERYKTFGIFCNRNLAGYITFDSHTIRIKQFGVHKNYRNKAIAHQLFYKVQLEIPDAEIFVINVDENDFETTAFLQKVGLFSFISQYEMVKS